VEQTATPDNNPYPGPDVTATPDNNPYPGPDQSLTPTQEQYTRTPTLTWTPSSTPTRTPTPTPVVLPTLQNTPIVLTNLPYQEKRILPDGKVNQAIWLSGESGLGLATSKGIFLIGLDGDDPEILDAGASVASIVQISDTNQIAAGGYDSLIRFWDAANGDFIKYLRGHLLGVVRLSYSPFGSFLASASDDATVRIWDGDGQHLHTLRGPITRVVDMAASINGQLVAAASNQNVHIWNPQTAELLHTISQPNGWYTAAAFSPNGQVLVTAYDGRRLETWDTTTWKRKDLIPVNAQVQSLEYNATGRLLAIAYQDGRIQIRDTFYRLILADLVGHPKVTGLSFSPDDDQLVSSSADGSIRIWDLTGMKIP
jgi:WD40 repeat protein